ncbi:hypothetical protein AB4098_01590 [Vibrio cyclitrophicus]
MKLIVKYGLGFLCIGFGLCGIFTLAHLYVEDKIGFSSLINDLGSFGSFLSGLGTLVAAAAAAVGVDSWVNQLKCGKYLDIIWAAKVAIRKVHASEMDWYRANYSHLENPIESSQLELEAKLKKLKYDFEELNNEFHQLDQVVVKNQFLWANRASHFKFTWLEILWHMEENKLSSEDLPRLNTAFNDYYDTLMELLEKLEMKYSK